MVLIQFILKRRTKKTNSIRRLYLQKIHRSELVADSRRITNTYQILQPRVNARLSNCSTITTTNKENKTPWPKFTSKRYRPSDRRLSTKLVPTFTDIECHMVNVADPYGRNLGFLDRSRYFFLLSSSSIVLTRLSGPRSRPTTFKKIW
jgi:hypothetical protein